MHIKTHNLQEFQKTARNFALGLTPLHDSATVVGLYGNLGSGKTTFVQTVAKTLGVTETLNSPTFLIFKNYPLNAKRYTLLVHADAYRLKNGEELRKLRFEELLRDPANLIFVEWADRVADILPKDHQKLYFEFM